ILAFMAGSGALHAPCFYVFQIVYQPTVALLPPPARVSVISPNTEAGRVLLRWIEAEDPALASTTQRPPETKNFALPMPQHRPTFLSGAPALRELPHTEEALPIPTTRLPASVPILRQTKSITPAKTIATAVEFSSEVTALGPLQKPAPHFVASTNEAPQN